MRKLSLPELDNIYSSFDVDIDEDNEDNEKEEYEPNSIFSEEDVIALHESMYCLIDDFIGNHPMHIKKMCFDEELENYVIENVELLYTQSSIDFENIYVKELVDNIVKDIYNHSRKEYFTHFMPPRSYISTFIRKKPNIDKMSEKINYLRNKPQPDQRTDEWYMFRYNLLTASSIWKAFSSQTIKNQLIYEKCTPLNIDKYKNVNTESAMHHGQKYEELSVMYYELIYKTKVEDFGCIEHDKYKYIGASPDGINVDISSDRYGRMLEIKNIVNREITGIPKEEYWIQMQLQMETCDLNECDFLETQFSEYESEEEFLNDSSEKMRGLLLYFMENGKPLYKYMPLQLKTYEEMSAWEDETIDKYSHLTWIKTIYWRLDKVSCVLVLRNKKWFTYALPYVEELWNFIEQERVSGYEHRAPKKQQRKRASSVVDVNTEDVGCLLDSSLFTDPLIPINTSYENIVIEKNSGELFTDMSFNTNVIN